VANWGERTDIHVVVWLAFDLSRVSRRAKAAIDKARKNGEGLAICDIALLELTALASKGRIYLDISLETFLREVEARFIVLPIAGRTCVLALRLAAAYLKDSADRIIAATALTQGSPLITADGEIQRSKALPTIC
jgi:PIN domain nuclease of toxin-antitoxin system